MVVYCVLVVCLTLLVRLKEKKDKKFVGLGLGKFRSVLVLGVLNCLSRLFIQKLEA